MNRSAPDPAEDPKVILFILSVLLVSLIFLTASCSAVPRHAQVKTEPTFLGDVTSDGYTYHHWRRADGTEYLELPGRTIDLP